MSSTKRKYKLRAIEETDPGVRPGAGNMDEVDLPGADLSLQRSYQQSNRARASLTPQRGKAGPTTGTFQATTDFGWRYGGEPILHRAAFGANETPPVVAVTADELSVTNNAIIKSGGWSGTGVTAGQMVLLTGATGNNPPLVLAPITEVVGTEARVDPDFVTFEAEPAASLTVAHAGCVRVGDLVKTLTLESWNPETAKGHEANGVTVNSWGLNVSYGNQGASPVQQTFGFGSLGAKLLSAQIPDLGTAAAVGATGFDSGKSFGDKASPLAGFGFRYNGTWLSEIFWDQIQVQFQAPTSYRAGAGHEEWQTLRRDQDHNLTVNLTFGWKERDGDTHQDLIVQGAEAKDVASIGFGFVDEQGRRCYAYMPTLEVTSLRLPSSAKSGDDTVQISYRGFAEETPLWGLLYLAWFATP